MELHHLRYAFGLDRRNKDERGASKGEMSVFQKKKKERREKCQKGCKLHSFGLPKRRRKKIKKEIEGPTIFYFHCFVAMQRNTEVPQFLCSINTLCMNTIYHVLYRFFFFWLEYC
jgi:hypothetical protein